jgi:plastocyanin
MSSLPRRLALCVAAAGALLPVALAAPAAAATHVVVIDKMKYAPVPPLKRGDVVEFVNRDMFRHTVTATNGKFNLDLMPGKSGKLRINSAGTVSFYCTYHPGMRGSMTAK